MELSENKIINEFNEQNVGNLIYNLENIKKNLEEILFLKQRNKEISEIIDIIKEFLSWINPFMDKDHKKTKEDLEKREGFIKKVKDKLGNYFKNNPEIKNLVEITNLINKSKEILLFLDDNIDFNPSENDIENKSINLDIEEDNPFFLMGEQSFGKKDNEEKKNLSYLFYSKDNYIENKDSENSNKININNNNNKKSLTEAKERFIQNFYSAINLLISKFDILASSNDNDIYFPPLKDMSITENLLEYFGMVLAIGTSIEYPNYSSKQTEAIIKEFKNYIEKFTNAQGTLEEYFEDECYEEGEDKKDNFNFVEAKKTLFYFINIISKENKKFSIDNLKKISENISNILQIENSHLILIQNSSIDDFVKSFNFHQITLKPNEIYPSISKFYELKSIKYKLLIKEYNIKEHFFDNRGNFLNPNSRKNKFRGNEIYDAPYSWMGIGLKVLGKYENDNWLEDICYNSEWAIAYRGISSKDPNFIKKKLIEFIESLDLKSAFMIFKKKMKDKRHWKFIENGIYMTPNIKVAEKYTQTISFNNKKYKVLLMAKVKISEIQQPKGSKFWILNNDDIRIYRVLFKEIKSA